MSKIFEDNSQTIGNTPLVRLNRVTKGRVLAKIESRNPSFASSAGSVPTSSGMPRNAAC